MEEADSLADGKLEHFVDVEAFVSDIENRALVASAAAIVADKFDVGEELHLDRARSIALARFSASAGHVERKMTGGVAALLRIARACEQAADNVERLEVGDGIRARRAADRSLVDHDDIADSRRSFDTRAGHARRF